MVSHGLSRGLILSSLSCKKSRGRREVVKKTGLDEDVVSINLYRCWKDGLILRTKKPLYEATKVFKGRGGVSRTTRPYPLYL
jgi:DNA-binding MarR family transcriptional regulator